MSIMDWCCVLFFFKQKTAYEVRISDWSSYVCYSDLVGGNGMRAGRRAVRLSDGHLLDVHHAAWAVVVPGRAGANARGEVIEDWSVDAHRWEERRVGYACVRPSRSRCWVYH